MQDHRNKEWADKIIAEQRGGNAGGSPSEKLPPFHASRDHRGVQTKMQSAVDRKCAYPYCDKPAKGKSLFCSRAHKQKHYRERNKSKRNST